MKTNTLYKITFLTSALLITLSGCSQQPPKNKPSKNDIVGTWLAVTPNNPNQQPTITLNSDGTFTTSNTSNTDYFYSKDFSNTIGKWEISKGYPPENEWEVKLQFITIKNSIEHTFTTNLQIRNAEPPYTLRALADDAGVLGTWHVFKRITKAAK